MSALGQKRSRASVGGLRQKRPPTSRYKKLDYAWYAKGTILLTDPLHCLDRAPRKARPVRRQVVLDDHKVRASIHRGVPEFLPIHRAIADVGEALLVEHGPG